MLEIVCSALLEIENCVAWFYAILLVYHENAHHSFLTWDPEALFMNCLVPPGTGVILFLEY